MSAERPAHLEVEYARERRVREDLEAELQEAEVARDVALNERQIAVNAAASKMPDFDVQALRIADQQRHNALRDLRQLKSHLRSLHTDNDGVCVTCTDEDDNPAIWPCRTARAAR